MRTSSATRSSAARGVLGSRSMTQLESPWGTSSQASSRVQPPELVGERERRAGQQHVNKAQRLEIAVERHPWQRREIITMRGEQHARPRRHGGLEAEFGGELELARAGRRGIAHWKSEMPRPLPQRRLD